MTTRTRFDSRPTSPVLPGLALAVVLVFGTACGGSSGSGSTPSDGNTHFPQAVRAADGQGESIPGYANVWRLGRNLTVSSANFYGFDHIDTGLILSVGSTIYPADQVYDDLDFSGPALGTADGITVADVFDGVLSDWDPHPSGLYSLSMAPTRNSRLIQTLDLTGAVPPIVLDFDADVDMGATSFADEPYYFRVLLKDTSNRVLESILYRGIAPDAGLGVPFNLSAYAGQVVRLSFEARMTPDSYVLLDRISVMDDDGTEYVTNGDFETGNISGWSRNTPSFYRNVSTTTRTVEELDVTRQFFALPDSLWGRTTDVFTNNTGATIDKTITYGTRLGADGFGIIYDTPGTSMQAVTAWDGDSVAGGRDMAWVFGASDSTTYTAASDIDTADGNDLIEVTFDISVPAGESVAIVHYLLQGGESTGIAAMDSSATADTLDEAAEDIVTDFATDASLTEGLSQDVIDAIVNL